MPIARVRAPTPRATRSRSGRRGPGTIREGRRCRCSRRGRRSGRPARRGGRASRRRSLARCGRARSARPAPSPSAHSHRRRRSRSPCTANAPPATCSKSSGSVQRDTAPSPITRIRPSNAVTCHPLVGFPRLSHPPRNCYRRGVEGDLPGEQDGLALDRETMRDARLIAPSTCSWSWLIDDTVPPLRRATPAEMRARLVRPAAPPSRSVSTSCSRRLDQRRAPVHEPRRPSRVLRVRPVRGHVARRPRRLHRERVQRLRGLVDGGGRPEPARARGARLVPDWIGYPTDAGGALRQRRLGGEHDGARVRARVASSAR